MQTPHQQRVEEFMAKAEQDLPDTPTIPDEEARLLRARLIMEEAMETIQAGLGVKALFRHDDCYDYPCGFGDLKFEIEGDVDLVEVADGCADISVVTVGTLSACGIKDGKLLEEVDGHNLKKFGPGGYKDEGGKWIKPPDLQPPDIEGILKEQGWSPSTSDSKKQ